MHTELPDVLVGRCHSSSAHIQCQGPTLYATLLHKDLPAKHAAERPYPENVWKNKNYFFINLISIVRLVFCLIFHWKNNFLVMFIKIVI